MTPPPNPKHSPLPTETKNPVEGILDWEQAMRGDGEPIQNQYDICDQEGVIATCWSKGHAREITRRCNEEAAWRAEHENAIASWRVDVANLAKQLNAHQEALRAIQKHCEEMQDRESGPHMSAGAVRLVQDAVYIMNITAATLALPVTAHPHDDAKGAM